MSAFPTAEDVALRRLENGLVLAARESWATPSVVLNGLFEVGSMDEAREQAGLARLTASLLTRGTARRSYEAINEEIEAVGASLGIGGGTHTTTLGLSALAEDAPRLIALAAETVIRPTFPEEHVARVRQQRLTVLADRATNSPALASLTFYETAYPEGHPYQRSTMGYLDTVAPLERADLVAFHERFYGPTDGILVLVGALPAEQALDLMEAAFGEWVPGPDARGRTPAPPVEPLDAPIERWLPLPSKTQSDLLYGLPAIPRTHPDFLPLWVANTVLGVFGMMGRVGKSVRDRQGLAYSARTALGGGLGPGAWVARAGVAPARVRQAVAAIREEWERLGRDLVPEDELTDSKALLVNSLPLALESNSGVAATIRDMLYYELGLDYLARHAGLIDRTSAEDVRRVSWTYFDANRAVLTVAGPPVGG